MLRIRSRRSWTSTPLTAVRHRLGTNSIPIVHHTAGPYGLTKNSTVAEEEAALRRIETDHRSRGWNNIGYSVVICPSGRAYTGRGWWRIPAAAIGFNSGNFHVCIVGNYETQKPTEESVKTLRQVIRRFRRRTGSKRTALGHYQVNPTSCPGKNLKPRVKRLP